MQKLLHLTAVIVWYLALNSRHPEIQSSSFRLLLQALTFQRQPLHGNGRSLAL